MGTGCEPETVGYRSRNPADPDRTAASPMPMEIDRRIVELARKQHGVVTRTQLLSAGATPKMVRTRLASERLVGLHRGVYLLGALAGLLEPPRAREMAAVLACGPSAVVSHGSAARLWDMLPGPGTEHAGRPLTRTRAGRPGPAGDPPTRTRAGRSGPTDDPPTRMRGGRRGSTGDPPTPTQGGITAAARRAGTTARTVPLDVTTPGNVRRRRPGVRCHRASELTPGETTVVDGISVTAPIRTIQDLATVLSARALNRAAAWAERRGLVTADDLARLAVRHVGRPGAPVLRASFGAGGELVLTRSEAEERLLDLIRGARLPSPEINVAVGPFEVDFLWRAEGVVVEVDGFRYHGSRGSFEADRGRDAALAARGLTVCRVTWRQLTHERDATLARVAGILASRSTYDRIADTV